MTGEEFQALLKEAGLSQKRFALLVEHFSGAKLAPSTTSRWAKDARGVNPLAITVIKLFLKLPLEERETLLNDAAGESRNSR